MGSRLRGVVHLQTGEVHLYEPGRNFTRHDSPIFASIDAPPLRERLGEAQFNALRDELELVQGASHPFDEAAYLAGKKTPVRSEEHTSELTSLKRTSSAAFVL